MNGAGGELGWLVTPRKPCEVVVDADVEVDGFEVVDDCSASLDLPTFSLPALKMSIFCGAMMRLG